MQTFNLDIFDHYVTLIGRFDLIHYLSNIWGLYIFVSSLLCSPRLHVFDKYSKTEILGIIIEM